MNCIQDSGFSCCCFTPSLITCCISLCLVRPVRAYTPQGYKTPTAEKARPVRAATTTPTSAQLSSTPLSSSAPKAFYGKSRQTAWQTEDTSPSPSNATTTCSNGSSKKYVSDWELQMTSFDLETFSSLMTWGSSPRVSTRWVTIVFLPTAYIFFLEHH